MCRPRQCQRGGTDKNWEKPSWGGAQNLPSPAELPGPPIAPGSPSWMSPHSAHPLVQTGPHPLHQHGSFSHCPTWLTESPILHPGWHPGSPSLPPSPSSQPTSLGWHSQASGPGHHRLSQTAAGAPCHPPFTWSQGQLFKNGTVSSPAENPQAVSHAYRTQDARALVLTSGIPCQEAPSALTLQLTAPNSTPCPLTQLTPAVHAEMITPTGSQATSYVICMVPVPQLPDSSIIRVQGLHPLEALSSLPRPRHVHGTYNRLSECFCMIERMTSRWRRNGVDSSNCCS